MSAIKNKLYFLRINKLFLETDKKKISKHSKLFITENTTSFQNFHCMASIHPGRNPLNVGPMDKWKEVLINQPQRYKKKRIKPTFLLLLLFFSSHCDKLNSQYNKKPDKDGCYRNDNNSICTKQLKIELFFSLLPFI